MAKANSPDGSKNNVATENGRVYVFVKSFKHWKSGKTLYAKDYGKRAFKIPIG